MPRPRITPRTPRIRARPPHILRTRRDTGSISTGYAPSASSAPTLDNANNRYGSDPSRESHFCSNGLVADRRKYGSPSTAVNIARICHAGSPAAYVDTTGFHRSPGITGNSSVSACQQRKRCAPTPASAGARTKYPASRAVWKKTRQVVHTADEPPNQR